MRLLAALSCLFTGVCIAAPHTPEQEYTLQARVVLQHDPAARDQLALWDAAAVPRNGIDWQRSLDDLPTWLRQQHLGVGDAGCHRCTAGATVDGHLRRGVPAAGQSRDWSIHARLRVARPGARSAPAALHRTHVVGWSSYRHGDVHEARSDQLYQAILLTLLPFEAWDMRIAGDVPPILLHD
ncbi:hypothetical protein NJH49_10930 [Stenotrophomonas maltophilia]|uniref:hypothetical protein n=1 Tax=Stenotrophomonas maltophilia TaxID=40324 RepID=UPI00209853B6|nr:hypothetical protein [Stenotrophomonas maltophilia]MCO7399661.1 hypothetical protein [Stenotrophomonas maltophilia]MCO7411898.1 hypothetical protein [Stenotrophomonas maltophilia]